MHKTSTSTATLNHLHGGTGHEIAERVIDLWTAGLSIATPNGSKPEPQKSISQYQSAFHAAVEAVVYFERVKSEALGVVKGAEDQKFPAEELAQSGRQAMEPTFSSLATATNNLKVAAAALVEAVLEVFPGNGPIKEKADALRDVMERPVRDDHTSLALPDDGPFCL